MGGNNTNIWDSTVHFYLISLELFLIWWRQSIGVIGGLFIEHSRSPRSVTVVLSFGFMLTFLWVLSVVLSIKRVKIIVFLIHLVYTSTLSWKIWKHNWSLQSCLLPFLKSSIFQFTHLLLKPFFSFSPFLVLLGNVLCILIIKHTRGVEDVCWEIVFAL